jgi:hypothetical protein
MKSKQGQVSVQHKSLRSFFAGGRLASCKKFDAKKHTHNACGAKFALASFQFRKYADETEK